MKKILIACGLILSSSNSFAAIVFEDHDERIIADPCRGPGCVDFGGGAGAVIGRGSGGGGGSRGTPSQGGGSGSSLSNAQLAELAIQQIGTIVTTLSSKNAWAYLKVTVTTPANLKVELELELGYGQVNVKSRNTLPR